MILFFERTERKEGDDWRKTIRYRQGRKRERPSWPQVAPALSVVSYTPLSAKLKEDRLIWERRVLKKRSSD